jgi:hypothetical protein
MRRKFKCNTRILFVAGLLFFCSLGRAQYKEQKHWLTAQTGVYSFNAAALSDYNGQEHPGLTGPYFRWSSSLQHSYGIGYKLRLKSLEIGFSLSYENWYQQYLFYPDVYFQPGNPPRPINNTLTRAEISLDYLNIGLSLGNYHSFKAWAVGYNFSLMGWLPLQNSIVNFTEPQSGNNQRIETTWEENTPAFTAVLEFAPGLRSYILRNKTLYIELQPFVRLPLNSALGEFDRFEQAVESGYMTKQKGVALHYGARLQLGWSIF